MIELLEGEKIILQKRRHWYIIASESSVLFFAAVVPALVFIWIVSALSYEVIAPVMPLIVFAFAGWFLILWIIFFIFWTNYYLDVLIVTNKRVIDIEQRGLFARDIAETSIKNIQDIKIEVIGILATLWDFGDIHIQTAGESREMAIRSIANPHEVRKKISEQHHETPRI
ncbi:MAG: PH domain-containing protein [Candidatus Spechtbacterales bacterium]